MLAVNGVLWWCEECGTEYVPNPWGFDDGHAEKHRIVGIREDILVGGVKRLVSELKRTDRLIPFESPNRKSK